MKFWVKLKGADDASSIKLVVKEEEMEDMDVFDLIVKLPPLIDVKGRKPSQLHLYAQMSINTLHSSTRDPQSLLEGCAANEIDSTVWTLIPNRMEIRELINKLPQPVSSVSFEVHLEDIDTGVNPLTSQPTKSQSRSAVSSSLTYNRLNTANGLSSRAYNSSTPSINTEEASNSTKPGTSTTSTGFTTRPVGNRTTTASPLKRSAMHGRTDSRSDNNQLNSDNNNRASNGSKNNSLKTELGLKYKLSRDSSVQSNFNTSTKRSVSSGSIMNRVASSVGHSSKSVGVSGNSVRERDTEQNHPQNEEIGTGHSRRLADAGVSEVPPLPPVVTTPHSTDVDKSAVVTEAEYEESIIARDTKQSGEKGECVLVTSSHAQRSSTAKMNPRPSPRPRSVSTTPQYEAGTENTTNTSAPPSPFSQQLSREQAASKNISYGPKYRTPSSSVSSMGFIGGKIKPVKEAILTTTFGPKPTSITAAVRNKSLQNAGSFETIQPSRTKNRRRDENLHSSFATKLNEGDVASTHKRDISKTASLMNGKDACDDFKPLWGKNICARCNHTKQIHVLAAKRRVQEDSIRMRESHEKNVENNPPIEQNNPRESDTKENIPATGHFTGKENAAASNKVKGPLLAKFPSQHLTNLTNVTPTKIVTSRNSSSTRKGPSVNSSPTFGIRSIPGLLNQSRPSSGYRRSTTPMNITENESKKSAPKEEMNEGKAKVSGSKSDVNGVVKSPTMIRPTPLSDGVETSIFTEEIVKEDTESSHMFLSSAKQASEEITVLQMENEPSVILKKSPNEKAISSCENTLFGFDDPNSPYGTVPRDTMKQYEFTPDPEVLAMGEAAVLALDAVDELFKIQAAKGQEQGVISKLSDTETSEHESRSIYESKIGSCGSSILQQRHPRLLDPEMEEELANQRSPLAFPDPGAPFNLASDNLLCDSPSDASAVIPKTMYFSPGDMTSPIVGNNVGLSESCILTSRPSHDIHNVTVENSEIKCNERREEINYLSASSNVEEEERILSQADPLKTSLYNHLGSIHTQSLHTERLQGLLALDADHTSAPDNISTVKCNDLSVSEISYDTLTEERNPATLADYVARSEQQEKQYIVYENHQKSTVEPNERDTNQENDDILGISGNVGEMEHSTNVDKTQYITDVCPLDLRDTTNSLFSSALSLCVEAHSDTVHEREKATLGDQGATVEVNLHTNSSASPFILRPSPFKLPCLEDNNDDIPPVTVQSLNEDNDQFSFFKDPYDSEMPESTIHKERTYKDTNKASQDEELIHAVFGTPLVVLSIKDGEMTSDTHVDEGNLISTHSSAKGQEVSDSFPSVDETQHYTDIDELSSSVSHLKSLTINITEDSHGNSFTADSYLKSSIENRQSTCQESSDSCIGNTANNKEKWEDVINHNHLMQESCNYPTGPISPLHSADITSAVEHGQHVLPRLVPIECNGSDIGRNAEAVTFTDAPKEWDVSLDAVSVQLSECNSRGDSQLLQDEGNSKRSPWAVKITHTVFEEY